MKILLHIDQAERWDAVCGNLKNLVNAKKSLRPDLEIEVVVTGDAIQQLVVDDENLALGTKLQQAVDAGFVIAGCHNSLNRFKIGETAIFPFVKVVPAGLIEVAAKEENGFAYVKP